MPQPRPEDRKIVVFPTRPARPDPAEPGDGTDPRGRVVLFTGVRCQRFPDEASFAAAMAALARAEAGRVAT
jgi:hypothetical protein